MFQSPLNTHGNEKASKIGTAKMNSTKLHHRYSPLKNIGEREGGGEGERRGEGRLKGVFQPKGPVYFMNHFALKLSPFHTGYGRFKREAARVCVAFHLRRKETKQSRTYHSDMIKHDLLLQKVEIKSSLRMGWDFKD